MTKNQKPIRYLERNYDDPLYKEFRKKVLQRDKNKCQWPHCGSRKHLRVHHIRTWAKYPALRFIVGNGIVLCKKHHDDIWSKEEDFEALFYYIVKRNNDDTRSKKQRSSRPIKSTRQKKKSKKVRKKSKNKKFLEEEYEKAKIRNSGRKRK